MDEDEADRTDCADRLRDSIGICLENTVRNQAFITGAISNLKREEFLHKYAKDLDHSMAPWLLHQPLLDDKSLFGLVSVTIRSVLKETRNLDLHSSVVKAFQSRSNYPKQQQNQFRGKGGNATQKGRNNKAASHPPPPPSLTSPSTQT